MKVGGVELDYRMDVRTKEQFEKDIAVGTAIEHDIIQKYKRYFEAIYHRELVVVDNGCDNSGGYLQDSQVTTKADFSLNGKLVEVKFNKHTMSVFRVKKSQLESYIRQGAIMLWVNGNGTATPTFTLLKVSQMEAIIKDKVPFEFATWGNKLCYQIYASEFVWSPLC